MFWPRQGHTRLSRASTQDTGLSGTISRITASVLSIVQRKTPNFVGSFFYWLVSEIVYIGGMTPSVSGFMSPLFS